MRSEGEDTDRMASTEPNTQQARSASSSCCKEVQPGGRAGEGAASSWAGLRPWVREVRLHSLSQSTHLLSPRPKRGFEWMSGDHSHAFHPGEASSLIKATWNLEIEASQNSESASCSPVLPGGMCGKEGMSTGPGPSCQLPPYHSGSPPASLQPRGGGGQLGRAPPGAPASVLSQNGLKSWSSVQHGCSSGQQFPGLKGHTQKGLQVPFRNVSRPPAESCQSLPQ